MKCHSNPYMQGSSGGQLQFVYQYKNGDPHKNLINSVSYMTKYNIIYWSERSIKFKQVI
jgi:hypothetical protein